MKNLKSTSNTCYIDEVSFDDSERHLVNIPSVAVLTETTIVHQRGGRQEVDRDRGGRQGARAREDQRYSSQTEGLATAARHIRSITEGDEKVNQFFSVLLLMSDSQRLCC